jgi:L-iditol 2-dehydrogenase
MTVAVLAGLKRIELTEVPVPEPGPGEVLLEVEAVGICGSDLHYWRCGRIADQVVKFPMRLGHEPAGRVAALGAGVTGLKKGQSVAIEPGIPCGTCRECQMGRVNLCPNVKFLGTPPIDGSFQPYLVMPASALAPRPDNVDAVMGALAEPLGVAVHSFDLMNLRAGERIAVIGAGSVGLCVIALARQMGVRIVAVSEPRPFRRKVAENLGAERTTTATPEKFIKAARDATDGHGVDVVFECSGAAEALNTTLSAAARGGRVAMIGIPEVDTLSIDPHIWRKRELNIINVRRSNRTLERCLRILERTDLGLKASGLVSTPIGLSGVQDAMVRLDDERSDAVKVMVDPRLV